MQKLWIDAETVAPDGWVHAKSFKDFEYYVCISDFDIMRFGVLEGKTAEDCVKWYLQCLKDANSKCCKEIYVSRDIKDRLKIVNLFDVYRKMSVDKFKVFIK